MTLFNFKYILLFFFLLEFVICIGYSNNIYFFYIFFFIVYYFFQTNKISYDFEIKSNFNFIRNKTNFYFFTYYYIMFLKKTLYKYISFFKNELVVVSY